MEIGKEKTVLKPQEKVKSLKKMTSAAFLPSEIKWKY